jgi:UDP-N-acetylmuramoyl-L-alanyl-D-glutamate--2,6-diaminopimelate ligase
MCSRPAPLTKGKSSPSRSEATVRSAQAQAVARYADLVITQEDLRLEDPKATSLRSRPARSTLGSAGADYLVIDDRGEAIRAAIGRAGPGDTVLLAGKGHESSIIVGEDKVPWDEAGAAREALRGVGFPA